MSLLSFNRYHVVFSLDNVEPEQWWVPELNTRDPYASATNVPRGIIQFGAMFPILKACIADHSISSANTNPIPLFD